MLPNIKKGIIEGKYGSEVKSLVNDEFEEKVYQTYLRKYIKNIAKQVTIKMLALKKI